MDDLLLRAKPWTTCAVEATTEGNEATLVFMQLWKFAFDYSTNRRKLEMQKRENETHQMRCIGIYLHYK